ncbi:MAG TPA: flagellar biosynthetic protein FliO [Candidatus Anaerobiospirillum stercoravium]|nr:flagellar biosynthetic protein FliO [Candidatus Anaerobiospirillum stercoravium]
MPARILPLILGSALSLSLALGATNLGAEEVTYNGASNGTTDVTVSAAAAVNAESGNAETVTASSPATASTLAQGKSFDATLSSFQSERAKPSGPLAENSLNTTTGLVKWLLSTVAILGVIFLFAFLLKKSRLVQRAVGPMRLEAQMAVGPKERVVQLQVGQRHILLGVTAANVNFLMDLTEPESPQSAAAAQASTPPQAAAPQSAPSSGPSAPNSAPSMAPSMAPNAVPPSAAPVPPYAPYGAYAPFAAAPAVPVAPYPSYGSAPYAPYGAAPFAPYGAAPHAPEVHSPEVHSPEGPSPELHTPELAGFTPRAQSAAAPASAPFNQEEFERFTAQFLAQMRARDPQPGQAAAQSAPPPAPDGAAAVSGAPFSEVLAQAYDQTTTAAQVAGLMDAGRAQQAATVEALQNTPWVADTELVPDPKLSEDELPHLPDELAQGAEPKAPQENAEPAAPAEPGR